jgi:L-ascorbate metabolism protein UlaG (beta-lactamase superfamily)
MGGYKMKSKLFKSVLAACVSLMVISGSSVYASTNNEIKIQYFGHSSFGISRNQEMKVVTDPYGEGMGYNFPKDISTEILTVSHDHFDHNNIAALKSFDAMLKGKTGKFDDGDIKVKGVFTYHDVDPNSEKGTNTIYTYEINKIKICHLGDLGHELSEELLKNIGKVDVLMIPVGGFFTIDAEKAVKVVNSINPKVVIPMHYETDETKISFEDLLAPVEDFTSKLKDWEVKQADSLVLTKQMLNTFTTKKVYVLNYK